MKHQAIAIGLILVGAAAVAADAVNLEDLQRRLDAAKREQDAKKPAAASPTPARPSPAPASRRSTLVLRSNAACALAFDGKVVTQLLPDELRSFEVAAGETMVECRSLFDPEARYEDISKLEGGRKTVLQIDMLERITAAKRKRDDARAQMARTTPALPPTQTPAPAPTPAPTTERRVPFPTARAPGPMTQPSANAGAAPSNRPTASTVASVNVDAARVPRPSEPALPPIRVPQSWNYQVFGTLLGAQRGEVALDGSAEGGYSLRYIGGPSIDVCYRGRISATVESTATHLLIVTHPTMASCGEERLVVALDGSGGVRQTRSGGRWVADGQNRLLTARR